MPPLIRAKCTQMAGMTCFSDLAIVLYYEIVRLGFDYNRIDTVFDRYFDDSLKEGTRKSRGMGYQLSTRRLLFVQLMLMF